MDSDKTLLLLRQSIDKIDDEIFEKLQKRMELVAQVGLHKSKNGSAIYRPEREREIIERLSGKKSSYLGSKAIEAIYQEIFAISRNLELPEKVAFLGPLGSYTHQAAEERFGAMSEYIPLKTITAVFEALDHKRAKYGVIPIENNSNGMVGETIDLLASSEQKIIAEIVLPIHHSFLSTCEHTSEIKTIFSKDIAFGQCQKFLHAHNFYYIEQIPTDSTAKAAQLAKNTPNSAAICSKVAAKLYDIPVMFENIEDSQNNKTRFVIVSDFANAASGKDKTSLFVNIRNMDQVGGLFMLLKDFKDQNINLTKIDSRPIRANNDFRMGFFIDCEGHYLDESLQKLFTKRGDEIKWLGSYMRTDTH